MADGSKIEWTDATSMVDRGGSRVRIYHRLDTSRPGQQLRRTMLALGLKWCRGCLAWLSAPLVGKNGLCRTHENEQARQRYANDSSFRDRRRAHAYFRRRNVERMAPPNAALVLELFSGECAYCNNPAETWDHVDPVSKGGKTFQGNVVPACRSCNSSKHDSDISDWLDRAPIIKPYTIEYLSIVGQMDGDL